MPFLILGIAVFLLVLAFVAILLWCYRKAFYFSNAQKKIGTRASVDQVRDELSHDPMLHLAEELEGCESESVSIRSRDGLTLCGRYYHISDQNHLEILFHGWRSNALRDGCGGAKLARDAGYNLLIVDQRAHGSSDGNTITFGVKEKYDCLDWVNYAIDRFGNDVRILLGGVSMGAATVLMASSLPLPPNVVGITADCPYSSPEAIIRKVCRDMGIPDRLGYPFVRISARLIGRFSLADSGAVEAVRHAKVPIMLMHGEEDDFVPFSMSLEILDAIASDKKFLAIPRAGHGLAYFYDTETYTREVTAFKLACLKQPPSLSYH